nr:hypothetical protein Iba_chr05cCG12580 [Ipomoea batatas]
MGPNQWRRQVEMPMHERAPTGHEAKARREAPEIARETQEEQDDRRRDSHESQAGETATGVRQERQPQETATGDSYGSRPQEIAMGDSHESQLGETATRAGHGR